MSFQQDIYQIDSGTRRACIPGSLVKRCKAHEDLDVIGPGFSVLKDGNHLSSWSSSCKAIGHISPALTCFIKAGYQNGVICFSARAMMLYDASQIILPAHGIYYHYQRAQGKQCFCHFVFLVTTKRGNVWLRSLVFQVKILYKSDLFNLYMGRSRFGCNYQALIDGG